MTTPGRPVDLDDLERKALTALARGSYSAADLSIMPEEVLALIVRTRELESGLLDAVDCDPHDLTSSWRKEMRALLKKGVVLP